MSETQSSSSSSFGPATAPANQPTADLLNNIAGIATQYANAMYSWGQGVFNNLQGNINGIMGNLEQSAQAAMSGANTALGQFTNSFIPDYQALRNDAQQYASPAREARNAGQAESDQMQANQSAIQQMEQKMQGYGINPSGPGYYGDLLAAKTAGAAGAAGAGNQSIRADEATALGLKKQALDYGIQMPGIAANFLNQANQARSIAGNLDIGTANAGTALMQLPNAYLNTAMQDKFQPVGSSGGSRSQSSGSRPSNQSNNQGSKTGNGTDTGNAWDTQTKNGAGSAKTVTAPPTNADGTLGNPFNVSYAEQTDSQGNPWQVGTDQMTGPNQVAITDYGSTDANYNDAFNYDQNSYLNGPNNVNIGDSGYTGDQQAYNDAYNYSPDSQSYDNTPTQDTSYNPMDSYSSDPSYSTDTSSWDLSSMDNSGGDYSGDYAQGGAIPDGPTTGGAIPQSASPSMGQQTDDIHAKVNADEFIMPRDVAIWKGQEFFYKLIADSRAKLAQAQQSGVGGKPSSPPTGPVRFASQAMR